MKRIYRQKSYCNKPLVVYEDGQKLGSFHRLEDILARWPDAVFKEAQVTIAPYTPKVKGTKRRA